jgi:hypothetical protein
MSECAGTFVKQRRSLSFVGRHFTAACDYTSPRHLKAVHSKASAAWGIGPNGQRQDAFWCAARACRPRGGCALEVGEDRGWDSHTTAPEPGRPMGRDRLAQTPAASVTNARDWLPEIHRAASRMLGHAHRAPPCSRAVGAEASTAAVVPRVLVAQIPNQGHRHGVRLGPAGRRAGGDG